MKKFIDLSGKRDKERSVVESWSNKEYLLNAKHQVPIVNRLYMGDPFDGCNEVRREIANKLSGYRRQDVKKGWYDPVTFISSDQLMEKLVVSRLRCHYCRRLLRVVYDNVRDETQWTLDRLDNDLGHSSDNTVIAGLKCNLQRRRIDDKKFLFTKQMRLIKKN